MSRVLYQDILRGGRYYLTGMITLKLAYRTPWLGTVTQALDEEQETVRKIEKERRSNNKKRENI